MAELGETTDSVALIPGNPDAIDRNIDAIRGRGQAMNQAGDNLQKIDSGSWKGPAGDAFRDKFSYEPVRWHRSSDAFEDVARQLENYVWTLRWAQREAQEAIYLYEDGQEATKRAEAEHKAAVQQAELQAMTVAAAGGVPTPVDIPFVDFGEEKRQAARDKLNRARQQLIEAGDRAAGVIHNKGDDAPEQSMWDAIGDALGGALDWLGRNATDLGHLSLDIAGMIPAIGEPADLLNAAWYTAEGKHADAVISAAAAVPFVGWAATSGKFIKKGDELLDAVKGSDEVEDAAKAKGPDRHGSVPAQPGLKEEFDKLPPGDSQHVRVVGSEGELRELFERWSQGGRTIEWSNYKGATVELSDGTAIGLRETSKSGGATIDIRFPDGSSKKIHYNGP